MRESIIRSNIIKYLRSAGAYARSVHGSPYMAGMPDIVACYNGKALMLEVKCPKKQATPLQAAELERWRNAGAIAEVVHSVEDVACLLKSIAPMTS